MSKIWQKGYELDTLIERFTVGRDYLLDEKLVPADCVASAAHARMLASIGVLSGTELSSIIEALGEIVRLSERGEFAVSRSEEDCHTAIEAYLTRSCGDAGKKIHTGRSRNDQVLAALRLYGREYLSLYLLELASAAEVLLDFAEKHALVPMPGRTHMQIAMPSSVGLWAASFAEALIDQGSLLRAAFDLQNQSPLGSAASYGVPMELNREMVAESLAFAKVQNNVLYVNNSRGLIELSVLSGIEQISLVLSKLAQDLILFSMPEFGYFGLPDRLCSGSSIMPQKKNPDALELVRARSAGVQAAADQIRGILRSLPSGYNRDFQDTKEPFLRGLETGFDLLKIMAFSMKELIVNEANLKKAFTPEIFATDAALELVVEGESFRDAYREVGTNLEKLTQRDPAASVLSRKYTGTSGNLALEKTRAGIDELRVFVREKRELSGEAFKTLLGFPVEIIIR